MKMLSANLFLVVATCTVAVLVIGMYGLFKGIADPMGCEMSYMRPRYLLLSPLNRTRLSIKYRLYLYRETFIDNSDIPSGVPVLFIPGQGGSHKQIRSIAAHTSTFIKEQLSKDRDNSQVDPHIPESTFDFFTVDFNEEFSALHGTTLLEEAEYVNEAIRYILDTFYTDIPSSTGSRVRPKSVILIGHSMGGMVARTSFVLNNHLKGSVQMIITLASPHLFPPVPFDYELYQTYNLVNSFWKTQYSLPSNENSLFNVTLLSISGGNLDTMVSSDLSMLAELVPDTNGLAVFSSSVPGIWTSSDHQCIVWCKQIVDKITKLLIAIADPSVDSQLVQKPSRISIISDSFQDFDSDFRIINRSSMEQNNWNTIRIPDIGNSLTLRGRKSGAVILDEDSIPKYFDIFYLDDSRQAADIRLCQKSESDYLICDQIEAGRRVPFNNHNAGLLTPYTEQTLLGDYQTKKYDLLLFETRTETARLTFQASNISEDALVLQPSWFDLVIGYHVEFSSESYRHRPLRLKTFQSSLPVYFVKVKYRSVENDKQKMPSVIKVSTSPFNQVKYWTRPDTFLIEYFSPAVYGYLDLYKVGIVDMHVWSEEIDSIFISFDPISSLAILLRRYALSIIVFAFSITIFGVFSQFREYQRTGSFPDNGNFFSTLSTRQLLLLLSRLIPATIFFYITGLVNYVTYFSGIENPHILIPILFTLAFGFTGIAFHVLELLIHLLSLFLIRKQQSHQISNRSKRIIYIVIIALAVLLYLPHQFAFALLFLIQLKQTIKAKVILNDHMRANRFDDGRDSIFETESTARDVSNYRTLLTFVLSLLVPFNVPAMMVWTKNFIMGWVSSADHNFLNILPMALVILLFDTPPLIHRLPKGFDIFNIILHSSLAITSVLFGLRHLYILPALSQLVFANLLLQHWLSTRHTRQKIK